MHEAAIRRSRVLFGSGLFCAESVLAAIAGELGVECELIPRIASGLCSGLARTGGPCGALSGSILALGMAVGRDSGEAPIEPTYELVRDVVGRFEARFGATSCAQLVGCDLATEEGQERFRERNQHEACTEYVAEATRFALEAIERVGSKKRQT